MANPKPKSKPKLSESQKREETLKENQKRISPEGVAAADAAARKALEEKYPGMFIPGTRTTAGIYRAR
jgi:hypothetical protein